jgi:hypothetical protein
MNRSKMPVVVERKLGRHQAEGLWWPNGKIEIDPRLKGRRRLEVLIHEMMHERHPHWTEEHVTAEAEILAKFLWKQGVRTLDTLPARK